MKLAGVAAFLESDIGNVAYFTDFTIVDLGGLASLEIAQHGFDAPLFLHYVFEEMKPDVIHLRGPFAANANVPIALIDRDYRTVEGLPTAPYADGWDVRREPERQGEATFPSAASGAAPTFTAVRRQCDAGARWRRVS